MLLPKYKCLGEHTDFFQRIDREFDQIDSVDKLWSKLSGYLDYLNFTLLESLVYRLDYPDLIKEMENYVDSFKDFQRCTLLCDFAKCSLKIPAVMRNLKQVVVFLKLDWNSCTLADLEKFQVHIIRKFNLPSFGMNLKRVSSDLGITFELPNGLASYMRHSIENTDMTSIYDEHGISSMYIDGDCFKHPVLRQYSAFLKDLYARHEGKNLSPFKLAVMKKREIAEGTNDYDNFTRKTFRGDQDDLVYSKDHIHEGDIGCPTDLTEYKDPRLILVEGVPGAGKTVFTNQFCYMWSQDKYLTNCKVLVLLPLRENKVRFAKELSDLFPHPQLQQAIAEEVEGRDGEGVALWLEGWNELDEHIREKSSLFLELVRGRVLPKATIIITSRPWATGSIRESTIDQHIEIISTPDIHFCQVLRTCRIHSENRRRFLDYVDSTPIMKATMHTPITANIVADVFQWSHDTRSTCPTTMTELYSSLTCKLLMEYFASSSGDSEKIQSLDDVPDITKGHLLVLCQQSWQGLVKRKSTFSSDEVRGETLGLMHEVKELYGGKDSQLSYQFIHLTHQEFLSAYHITQLQPDEQEQIIRDLIHTGFHAMTVRFFFGLTKPNTFATSTLSKCIAIQHHCTRVDVFHWLYEAVDLETFDKPEKRSVKSSTAWSSLDYFLVGHTILQHDFLWQLDFRDSCIGDEEMKAFFTGLALCKMVKSEHVEVNFSNNKFSFGWVESLKIESLEAIKKLQLNFAELDRTALNAFTKFIPKLTGLEHVFLSNNPIGSGGGAELLTSFFSFKIPLKTLNLQHTDIGMQDSVALAKLLQNNVLETLIISGDFLFSIAKHALPNCTCTLNVLDVSQSKLSEEPTKSLAVILKQSTLRFAELNISRCEIVSDGAVMLAKALTSNSWLTELDMSGNNIQDDGAKELGKMLKHSFTLRKLYLRECGIAGDGCSELAAGLVKNSMLQKLDMCGNMIGINGCSALGRMLVQNSVLLELDLRSNKLASLKEGVSALISSLYKNSSLRKLTLSKQCQCRSDSRVEWW